MSIAGDSNYRRGEMSRAVALWLLAGVASSVLRYGYPRPRLTPHLASYNAVL